MNTEADELRLRRFVLWTLVCGISAVPSFIWSVAAHGSSVPGMLVGVLLFIVAYTAVTSTEAFQRFERRRGVCTTLRIVYGTRLGMSIIFPVGMAVDLFPGMLAVAITTGLSGDWEYASFGQTLAITLLQGVFLNILLALYALPVYVITRAVQKPRPGTSRCLRCGYDVRGLGGDCPNCGTPIEATLCPKCNYDLRATLDRCPECGTPVPAGHRPSIVTQ